MAIWLYLPQHTRKARASHCWQSWLSCCFDSWKSSCNITIISLQTTDYRAPPPVPVRLMRDCVWERPSNSRTTWQSFSWSFNAQGVTEWRKRETVKLYQVNFTLCHKLNYWQGIKVNLLGRIWLFLLSMYFNYCKHEHVTLWWQFDNFQIIET